jgi:hypothetical protein
MTDPQSITTSAHMLRFFTPTLLRKYPEGSAKKKPAKAKADISHPEYARLISICCMILCIIGGTLNWLTGAASPDK